MNRRTFLGAVSSALAALVALACGSVVRPGQAASRPPAPSPFASPSGPASDQPVITFVMRQGADPEAVGRRIGGPDATVRRAYPNPPRENAPMNTIVRTFVVTVTPGQEQAALQRARADPDVQQAWFGTHLGA